MVLANPWWVNLLALVPAFCFVFLRRRKLWLENQTLLAALTFGIAFGLVEAAVVVYLRCATGLLTISQGALSPVVNPGSLEPITQVVNSLPASLIGVEKLREAATLVMLISVAILGVKNIVGRFALFFWTFAVWDIAYYAGLWLLIRWPASIRDIDVLFLLPTPWVSEVWFPLAVSGMTLASVVAARKPVGR